MHKIIVIVGVVLFLGLLTWKVALPVMQGSAQNRLPKHNDHASAGGFGPEEKYSKSGATGDQFRPVPGSKAIEARAVTGDVGSGTNLMKDFRSLDYKPVLYSGGIPRYDGEAVTAYVAVPSSGEKLAMTVNQMGEYPRVRVKPSERVKVLLQFTNLPEGTPVSFVAQDGGVMENNKAGLARQTDAQKQVAFEYQLSANDGVHRIHVTTANGEAKTLDFWVGPENVMATK